MYNLPRRGKGKLIRTYTVNKHAGKHIEATKNLSDSSHIPCLWEITSCRACPSAWWPLFLKYTPQHQKLVSLSLAVSTSFSDTFTSPNSGQHFPSLGAILRNRT